ncbi:MAG: hypothetical protein KC548_04830, partial [Nanoarchaeota archaeon]|nr:hypothetical protein [Nanoarchaeota archaeon]
MDLDMKIRRFDRNPLIHQDLDGLKGLLGSNINGPSIIRTPDWIKNPLGKYYLYFAHHKGSYIRLAYADSIEGPWRLHSQGVLHLEEAPCEDHIASPDVHIDSINQKLIMYFH